MGNLAVSLVQPLVPNVKMASEVGRKTVFWTAACSHPHCVIPSSPSSGFFDRQRFGIGSKRHLAAHPRIRRCSDRTSKLRPVRRSLCIPAVFPSSHIPSAHIGCIFAILNPHNGSSIPTQDNPSLLPSCFPCSVAPISVPFCLCSTLIVTTQLWSTLHHFRVSDSEQLRCILSGRSHWHKCSRALMTFVMVGLYWTSLFSLGSFGSL